MSIKIKQSIYIVIEYLIKGYTNSLFIMKLPIITALLLLFFSATINAQTRLKLSDALAKGFIKLKIMGNDGHTGKCATFQTENTTSQILDIEIDCGQKIQCSDSTAQNLVVTQSEHIRLTAKRMVATAVYAMCINAHKGSPGKVAFRLGQMAQGALLRITHFIEKKKYQNSSAQSAIWNITDNYEIATIGNSEGNDYEMTNELRAFIAKEKKILNYPKAKPVLRTEKTQEGTFDLILQNKANVQIMLMNANHQIVKRYLNAVKEAGIIRINYAVKNTDYKAGTYYLVARVGTKEVKRELILLE